MALAPNKTKTVCTIGPASESPGILRKMLDAGMNVARLNFSHGNFAWHKAVIENIRGAAAESGKRVAIMADLPGPKIRIGQLAEDPVFLIQGEEFTLTTDEITGDPRRVSVSFTRLPAVVRPGNLLFLNDGNIQLEVIKTEYNRVVCRVIVSGELRSRKGLNLPGIDLGISAFTGHDHNCLKFALENGVDAISQSFVEKASDIEAVRNAAAKMGRQPFIIAKIERARALEKVDEILKAADGIMIARGDLGVETPLERMAVVQKHLIGKANFCGKPVITATQMLESMSRHRRPTRAETTDVANAILDGTDCVMLSEESAMGDFPVKALEMLVRIAEVTEPYRSDVHVGKALAENAGDVCLVDLISRNVQLTTANISPAAVIVPTITGYTARMVSRFKLPVWIAAVSPNEAACNGLLFSYGVHPVHEPEYPGDWNAFAGQWMKRQGLPEGKLALLMAGPSPHNPETNPRMEIIDPRRKAMPR